MRRSMRFHSVRKILIGGLQRDCPGLNVLAVVTKEGLGNFFVLTNPILFGVPSAEQQDGCGSK